MERLGTIWLFMPQCPNGTKINGWLKTRGWNAIIKEIGISSVEEGKNWFNNIKKKFNKRRRESKGPSDTGKKNIQDDVERFIDMMMLTGR